MKKNKKKIILIGAILVIVIGIIGIKYYINKAEMFEKQYISFEEAFSFTNMEEYNQILIKNTKEKIMERYTINREDNTDIKVLKNKVDFENIEGKLIYSRNTNIKANIFQVTTNVNNYTECLNTIKEFEEICKNYLKITDDKFSLYLYNTSDIYKEIIKHPLYQAIPAYPKYPIYDDVYNKGIEGCKVYKIDKQEYNINFYIFNSKLYLEFVKIID